MSQNLLAQLSEILEKHLTALEAVKQSLKDAGDPNWNDLSVGLSSFRSVEKAVGSRLDSDFYKQGMKYLRKASKGVDNATLTSFLDGLKPWEKAWTARSLPNEAFVRELINIQLPLLAAGPLGRKEQGHNGGVTEDKPKGGAWMYLDGQRDGVFVSHGKRHLVLSFADKELVDRIFKELNKMLGKAMAKPTGSAKNKTFTADGLSIATERMGDRSGGAYPFDIETLTISNQKGKAERSFQSI